MPHYPGILPSHIHKVITPERFGAAGNGVADDTDALQEALNFASSTTSGLGGIVYLDPKRRYLIDSANLGVPARCIIAGGFIQTNTVSYASWGTIGSCLIVNPDYRIRLGSGGLSGVVTQRKGMTFPTVAQGTLPHADQLAEIAAYDGLAIEYISSGAKLRDVALMGFLRAIRPTLIGTIAPTTGSSNTGDGITVSTSFTDGAIAGTIDIVEANYGPHELVCTTGGGPGVGQFSVTDPEGTSLGTATVGTPFTGGGLTFTIPDGATNWALNDELTVSIGSTNLAENEFRHLGIDCHWGIQIGLDGGGTFIDNVRCENMLTQADGSDFSSNLRDGIAFDIWQSSAPRLSDLFAIYYAGGIRLTNSVGANIENPILDSPAIAKGIHVRGTAIDTTITAPKIYSYEHGIYVDVDPLANGKRNVFISNLSAAACVESGITVNRGHVVVSGGQCRSAPHSLEPSGTGAGATTLQSGAKLILRDVEVWANSIGLKCDAGTLDARGCEIHDNDTAYTGTPTFGATVVSERFTASGTYTPVDGLIKVHVICTGAGGSGAGGGKAATSTAVSGGGGGGGGGRVERWIEGSAIGATETVTVAGSQTGGAGATVAGAGADGVAGGTTSFGSHVVARGGGAPSGGNQSANSGGGAGGSTRSVGGNASGATGGSATNSIAGTDGGSGASATHTALRTGGAGGGGCASGSGGGGGGTAFDGGGGGGAGGGVDAANAFKAGGAVFSPVTTSSTAGGSTEGAAGTAGATETIRAGNGGSGGAGSDVGNGGAGGAGGIPGGGGGGGGASHSGNGGAGGAGGRGEVLVTSFY